MSGMIVKFGQTSANEVRRRRPRCGDTWHRDAHVPEDQRENVLAGYLAYSMVYFSRDDHTVLSPE
jgi:hypothetical protein